MISGWWKENFVTIQKVAAKITSINLTRSPSSSASPPRSPGTHLFPFLPEFHAFLTKLSPAPSAAPVWGWCLCPSHILPSPREPPAQHSRRSRVRSSYLKKFWAQVNAYQGGQRKRARPVCALYKLHVKWEIFNKPKNVKTWYIPHLSIHLSFLFLRIYSMLDVLEWLRWMNGLIKYLFGSNCVLPTLLGPGFMAVNKAEVPACV